MRSAESSKSSRSFLYTHKEFCQTYNHTNANCGMPFPNTYLCMHLFCFVLMKGWNGIFFNVEKSLVHSSSVLNCNVFQSHLTLTQRGMLLNQLKESIELLSLLSFFLWFGMLIYLAPACFNWTPKVKIKCISTKYNCTLHCEAGKLPSNGQWLWDLPWAFYSGLVQCWAPFVMWTLSIML